jgi:glucokinase
MKASRLILVADIGGTRIKLGLVRGERLLAQTEIDADARRGLALALERIARSVPALCREAGVKLSALAGFGLSFSGIIEPRTEKILSTPAGKFDDAKNLNVSKIVAARLGLPARICNDANAALLGEWRFGAARGCGSAVMLTLGTGIGAAAIINGVPLRGQHGQAGCLGGHLTVNWSGHECLCGNVGCAESEASTWALPALARAHPDFAGSRLAREKVLDYAAVFRAAAQRDRVAIELRDRAIRVWSVALVNLIHAYDPELAVIGGGIMRSGKIILPVMRRHVMRHAWTPWGKVKIKPAALGNNAGLMGVASLFQDEQ